MCTYGPVAPPPPLSLYRPRRNMIELKALFKRGLR